MILQNFINPLCSTSDPYKKFTIKIFTYQSNQNLLQIHWKYIKDHNSRSLNGTNLPLTAFVYRHVECLSTTFEIITPSDATLPYHMLVATKQCVLYSVKLNCFILGKCSFSVSSVSSVDLTLLRRTKKAFWVPKFQILNPPSFSVFSK